MRRISIDLNVRDDTGQLLRIAKWRFEAHPLTVGQLVIGIAGIEFEDDYEDESWYLEVVAEDDRHWFLEHKGPGPPLNE